MTSNELCLFFWAKKIREKEQFPTIWSLRDEHFRLASLKCTLGTFLKVNCNFDLRLLACKRIADQNQKLSERSQIDHELDPEILGNPKVYLHTAYTLAILK